MADKLDRRSRQPRPMGSWLPLLFAPLLACAAANPAWCQGVPPVHILTSAQPILLAQNAAVPSPGVLPTDATKGNFLQDQATAYPGFKLRLSQKLPARMWIQGSTEVNQRLDTNVFLTYKKPQPDYVFRVAPNLTVGYNVLNNTSVYAQYFVIKDCYTVHHLPLTPPTTQSFAMGLRHYLFPAMFNGRFSQTYLDCQVRELWQSKGLRQADLTPSVNFSYIASNHLSLFSSITLQMRSRQPFEGPHREMDPFYTAGAYWRQGKWLFSITDTFVTNFREPHFRLSIPKQGNVNMIADFEIDRQLGNHPGIQLFLRGEPVFNWRGNNVPGLSGFDFRLYSGLRLSFYKPSYLNTMNQIKKSLQQQDGDDPNLLKGKSKGKGKGKGKGTGSGDPKTNPDGTTTPTPTNADPQHTSKKTPGASPTYTPDPAEATPPPVVSSAPSAPVTPAVAAASATTTPTSADTTPASVTTTPAPAETTPAAAKPASKDAASPMAHKIDDTQKAAEG